jgi:hypothetical protein
MSDKAAEIAEHQRVMGIRRRADLDRRVAVGEAVEPRGSHQHRRHGDAGVDLKTRERQQLRDAQSARSWPRIIPARAKTANPRAELLRAGRAETNRAALDLTAA